MGQPALAGGTAAEADVLRHLAAALAIDGVDVFQAGLRAALATTGARRGLVLCREQGQDLAAVATHVPDGEEEADLRVERLDRALDGEVVRWRSGEPTPAPVPWAGRPGWHDVLAAPLRVRGTEEAAIVIADPGDRPFDEDARERLALVAAVTAAAAVNVRLGDDLRRLADLLRAVVETTAALVEATDPTTLRRRLLEGLHDDVGLDAAVLWVPGDEPGSLVLADEAGLPDDVRVALTSLSASTTAGRLLSSTLRGAAGGVTAEASTAWPGRRVHLVRVPEPAPGVLGVYADRPLPSLVGEVLATLGHTVAAAVHQLTLHQRAKTVVDSLQRQLRPRHVDLPADAESGHVYRSATAGADVGGDFFDVFMTASGHIGLVCGDVSGKGVEAASLTAMAVYSLRAYALRGTSPQVALAMLNGAVCAQTDDERFMTLAYARIDPVEWTVEVTVAGHPSPLLVGPDGVELCEVPPDVPVGLDPDATYQQHELRLEPGTSLLLHTDGVTEARRGERGTGELLGTERLLDALAHRGGIGAQALADTVWDCVSEWTGGGTTDDTAVVVLRRAPRS